MHCWTWLGGGGTKAALPGRDPPIQFCDRRNSPGVMAAPRPFANNLACISRMRRFEIGKPPRNRLTP